MPNKKRDSSKYLLSTDICTVFLDCGNGMAWKLEEIGVDYLEIDHVFITDFELQIGRIS